MKSPHLVEVSSYEKLIGKFDGTFDRLTDWIIDRDFPLDGIFNGKMEAVWEKNGMFDVG